jgi:hypothetical protein
LFGEHFKDYQPEIAGIKEAFPPSAKAKRVLAGSKTSGPPAAESAVGPFVRPETAPVVPGKAGPAMGPAPAAGTFILFRIVVCHGFSP